MNNIQNTKIQRCTSLLILISTYMYSAKLVYFSQIIITESHDKSS